MRFIKPIAIFILAFLLSLSFLELFISIAEIQSKSVNKIDTQLGRVRVPNSKYLYFSEGFGLGQYNNYGYLGPDYPPERVDSTLRIALLGDSYVEGYAVFDRHHFRSILEDSLRKFFNRKVEVLNFGHSGFRLGNMFAYHEIFVKNFKPDLCLFFVFELSISNSTGDYFPKMYVSKDSLIIDSLNLKKDYKKEVWNNKLVSLSSIISLSKNVFTLIQDKNYLLAILLDKFYHNPKGNLGEAPLKQTNISQRDSEVVEKIIQNLSNKNVWIVNRGVEGEPLLEKGIGLKEIILKPYLDSAFPNPQEAVFWPVMNKYGHWNQKAHRIVAEALAGEIIQFYSQNPFPGPNANQPALAKMQSKSGEAARL